jgi:hypothetical protein
MSGRRSVGLAVACLLVLACAACARAQDRSYWRDEKGYFENTQGKEWVEERGNTKHHFVEKEQTDDYVELHDKNRDITVRLFNDHCTIRSGKKKNFDKAYDGEFEKVLMGLDQEALDKARNVYEAKGWHPVHVKGYDGKEPQYDITWRSGPSPAWNLGFFRSAKDFGKQDAKMKKDGKKVAVETHYKVAGKECFAAIWSADK